MLTNEEQERRWYYAGWTRTAAAFDAAARLEEAEDALADALDELTAAKARAEELRQDLAESKARLTCAKEVQQDLEKSIAKLKSVLHN